MGSKYTFLCLFRTWRSVKNDASSWTANKIKSKILWSRWSSVSSIICSWLKSEFLLNKNLYFIEAQQKVSGVDYISVKILNLNGNIQYCPSDGKFGYFSSKVINKLKHVESDKSEK